MGRDLRLFLVGLVAGGLLMVAWVVYITPLAEYCDRVA